MLGRGAPSIGKWGRRIDANDASAALTVNQRGTGDILDLQDGGVSVFKVADGGAISVAAPIGDDVLFKVGTDGDGVLLNKSAGLAADTVLASVLVGTVEAQAIAANSLMIANATSNGDIALYTNKGGNSQMGLWLDGSSGDTALLAASGASVDFYVAGTKIIDIAAGTMTVPDGFIIRAAGAPVLTFDDTGDQLELTGGPLLIGSATAYSLFTKQLEVNSTSAAGGIAINVWEGTQAGGYLDFNASKGATPGTYTAMETGNLLGVIMFRGADGTNWQNSAYIASLVTGTVGADRMPGLLEFHCYTDAATSVNTTVLSMTAALITASSITLFESGIRLADTQVIDTALSDGASYVLRARNTAAQAQTVLTVVGAATVANSYITAQVGGTWTLASGATWTLPAHTLSGAITMGGNYIDTLAYLLITVNNDSSVQSDRVVLGGYDLSPGNRALAIGQEAPVEADVDETKFSNKLPVRINGVTYYIMLTVS